MACTAQIRNVLGRIVTGLYLASGHGGFLFRFGKQIFSTDCSSLFDCFIDQCVTALFCFYEQGNKREAPNFSH